MQVRLYNPSMANSSVSRNTQCYFDNEGVAVSGDLEDIEMLIREYGCGIIEVIEGGNNVELKVIDLARFTNRGVAGDEELLTELKQMEQKAMKVFIVKDSKILFFR